MSFRLWILVIFPWYAPFVNACEENPASWQRHLIDGFSRGADGARIADVNGDGLADLVTPWEEGGIIRVCLHPGKRKVHHPWPAVTVGKVASPEDAVFVDLDQDGRVDVVSSSEGSLRSIHVHWAPKDPERYLAEEDWQTEVVPATQGLQAWMFALPMNLDGQYGPDLIVSSKGAGASVGWLQPPAD
ncbi:MAG: VCBS repeat-containing protein, partial [Planctomycetota bacterium]|nr:VCBS repeat-containing protein [Planctomycetota bacterium]